MLRSLPVELFIQLETPVLAFQEADVYEIHRARSTGVLHFRNQGIAMIRFGYKQVRKKWMVR